MAGGAAFAGKPSVLVHEHILVDFVGACEPFDCGAELMNRVCIRVILVRLSGRNGFRSSISAARAFHDLALDMLNISTQQGPV